MQKEGLLCFLFVFGRDKADHRGLSEWTSIVKKAYKFLIELFTFWCLCAKIKVAFKDKRSAFQ